MKRNNQSIFPINIILLILLLSSCTHVPVYRLFNAELSHAPYRYFTYPWEVSYVNKNPAYVADYPPNARIPGPPAPFQCVANYPLPYTLTSPTSLFVKHLFGTC